MNIIMHLTTSVYGMLFTYIVKNSKLAQLLVVLLVLAVVHERSDPDPVWSQDVHERSDPDPVWSQDVLNHPLQKQDNSSHTST